MLKKLLKISNHFQKIELNQLQLHIFIIKFKLALKYQMI